MNFDTQFFPPAAPPCPIAPANAQGAAAPRGPGGESSRLVNFANLLQIVVVGSPTEQQLGVLESHFRAVNLLSIAGRYDLRQLREQTEQHGTYPVVVFNEASGSEPIMLQRSRTARPDERLDPSTLANGNALVVHSEERQILDLIASVSLQLLRSQREGWTAREPVIHVLPTGLPRHLAELTRFSTERQAPLPSSLPTGLEILNRVNAAASQLARWMIESPSEAPQWLPRVQPSWNKALQPWLGVHCGPLSDAWHAIEREARSDEDIKGIAAFKQFLMRLAETNVHRHPGQRDEVVKWLGRAVLPENSLLRAEAFETCIEGTESCQDNILLTWNKLAMLAIEVDVQEGRYQGRLADLHDVALSIFRMNELEKVASSKVEQLYEQKKQGSKEIIDPLETHLAYQIELRQALNLPIHVGDMYFQNSSRVTQEDADAALLTIRKAEKECFPAWLLLDFDPFLAEVKQRLGTEASAKVANDAIETYETTFAQRLAEKLHAQGLPDNDIERQKMSIQVSREIQYAAWLPHANAVLASTGLPTLPALDEDETRRATRLLDGALMV